MTNHSLRTMVFVPGYMEKFLERARTFPADALILDLEDSVPEAYKAEARRNIRKFLEEDAYSQQVYVRLNSMGSGMLDEDLKWVVHRNTTGFMPSKIQDEQDVIFLDRHLAQLEQSHGLEVGRLKLCPLIETASAVLRSYEIAMAAERLVALAFGGEDYLTDLDGLHKEHGASLLVPRSLIVIAARAARKEVIDTPFLNIQDLEGFLREAELARELGFSGALIIHPSQIEPANAVFSPSDAEIAEAERIVRSIEESSSGGLGVALLDGKLVGPPMLSRARNILLKAERIEKTHDGGD